MAATGAAPAGARPSREFHVHTSTFGITATPPNWMIRPLDQNRSQNRPLVCDI